MRIDRGGAFAPDAQRAAEAEIVGLQQQQARDVGRFQRAGEADEQVVLSRRGDEVAQTRDIHVVEEAAAALIGRVEHRAGEVGFRHHRQQRVVGAAIREHDANDLGLAREGRERPDAVLALRSGKQPDLNVVDAGLRHARRCRQDRIGLHRQVAGDRARRSPACDCLDRRPHHLRRQRAEGAASGVLEIDDVGAVRERDLGLVGSVHAGEEQRHGTTP
jgi:hypothetical protein